MTFQFFSCRIETRITQNCGSRSDELLAADRGGLIFEPEIGVHENVAEFDFVSLYPNIMGLKRLVL
jgi:DNA polymerase elongation subunit (family B)